MDPSGMDQVLGWHLWQLADQGKQVGTGEKGPCLDLDLSRDGILCRRPWEGTGGAKRGSNQRVPIL